MPNKSSPHGGFISEGSISTGTLRTQDLLRTFADELDRVFPFNGARLANEAREAATACDASGQPATDEALELADSVLEDVIAQLTTIASREGLQFGHSEGDGSDFGYWSLENEEG